MEKVTFQTYEHEMNYNNYVVQYEKPLYLNQFKHVRNSSHIAQH